MSTMTMYTVHAHWDLRWSSNIPAFASELSSSLANVKGDLFLSPAVLCIGKLSKNVEVLVIGQAAIGRGRGYTTDTDKWRRSGGCVRVQCHIPFPQPTARLFFFFFWNC